MNFPIYKLSLSDNPETGVAFIALVDDPAIQRHFLAFKNQEPVEVRFRATDSDQHIISGPLMVADMCIYREDEIHGPHYVYFDAETIRQIVLRFFRDGKTANINLMHLTDVQPDGIYMFESFIVDSMRGIQVPAGFDTLPDGSWFGSFKVDNPVVWEHFIKTGEFKGFSVEGFFNYEAPQSPEETQIKEIMEVVKEVE
jgi:hypothetical protein